MTRTNKEILKMSMLEFREMESDTKTLDKIDELLNGEDTFATLMSCVSYIMARSPNFERRMNDSITKFKMVLADILYEPESIN